VNNRHAKWKSHAVCGNSDTKTIRIVQCHTVWGAARRSAVDVPPEVTCTAADAQSYGDHSGGETESLPPADQSVDTSAPVIGLVAPPEVDPVAMYEDKYSPINIWCYIPPDFATAGMGAFELPDGTPCLAFTVEAKQVASSCGAAAGYSDLTSLAYSEGGEVYDVYGRAPVDTTSVRLGVESAELTGRAYVVRSVDRRTARRAPVATLRSGEQVVLPRAPAGAIFK
jgi:hypothetical protein